MTALDLPHPPAWMDEGACVNSGYPDAWFPEKGNNAIHARRICETRCPVRRECLDHALADNLEGLWGGVSERRRQRMSVGDPFPRSPVRARNIPAAGSPEVAARIAAVRKCRDEEGLTRVEIAERLSISETTVTRDLRGSRNAGDANNEGAPS